MMDIKRLARIPPTGPHRLAALLFLWKGPGRSADNPRKQEAFRLVKLYTTLSVPGGLVPIPFGDLVLVTTLQLRMLERIARVYGVTFCTDKTNGLLAAVGTAASASWVVIGPGSVVAGIGLGALEATVTFALGQVFIEHFESGGTLLDFDAAAAREALAARAGLRNGRMRCPGWLRRRH
jgi:uncharacterized protein (DUF697 family)